MVVTYYIEFFRTRVDRHNSFNAFSPSSYRDNREGLFRLPRDKEKRERWMNITLRGNIPVTSNSVICEKHLPSSYETVIAFGRKKDPEILHRYLGV